jgi:hypothetical protein
MTSKELWDELLCGKTVTVSLSTEAKRVLIVQLNSHKHRYKREINKYGMTEIDAVGSDVVRIVSTDNENEYNVFLGPRVSRSSINFDIIAIKES